MNDAKIRLKKFVEDCAIENNVKIITCALMGHGLNMRQENAEGDWWEKEPILALNLIWSIFDFRLMVEFRIQFSDNESIRMINLIQPIVDCEKFKGIPKMIISQFCRGRFMDNRTLAATDGPNGLAQSVNPQVCFQSVKMARPRYRGLYDCKFSP